MWRNVSCSPKPMFSFSWTRFVYKSSRPCNLVIWLCSRNYGEDQMPNIWLVCDEQEITLYCVSHWVILKFWVFVTTSSINCLQNMQCLSNENNLISEFLNLQCVMISYLTLFFSAYFSILSWLIIIIDFFLLWLYPLSKDPSGYTRCFMCRSCV